MSIFKRIKKRLNPAFNSFIGYSYQSKPKTVTALKSYKNVSLVLNNSFIKFQSPTYSHIQTGVIGKAKCNWLDDPTALASHKNHAVGIDTNCTCGFYSFKELQPAFNYELMSLYISSNIAIEVINSGKFIEYEDGYRSEIQRVTKIILKTCVECRFNAATCFVKENNYLRPSCTSCAKAKTTPSLTYTFEEAEALIEKPDNFNHEMPKVVSYTNAIPATRKELDHHKLWRKFYNEGEPFSLFGLVIVGTAGLTGLLISQVLFR